MVWISGRCQTYTHEHRDRNQHRLPEEDLERTRDDLLDFLAKADLVALHGSPPAVITSLLTQLLRTLDEQKRPEK